MTVAIDCSARKMTAAVNLCQKGDAIVDFCQDGNGEGEFADNVEIVKLYSCVRSVMDNSDHSFDRSACRITCFN